eukprot:6173241-Pleurochrysis_carterae.AAC.1
MADASNAAAGAVLMQWQRPPQWNNEERELLLEPDDNDEFVSPHRKRMEAGYRLKVLSYFSKSFILRSGTGLHSTKKRHLFSWPSLIGTDSSHTERPRFTQPVQLLLACSATT